MAARSRHGAFFFFFKKKSLERSVVCCVRGGEQYRSYVALTVGTTGGKHGAMLEEILNF